jgi:hypothetical protein
MGMVYAGGSPNFDERTGQFKQPPAQSQYKQAYDAAKKPFDPTALMKQYGYQAGPVTRVTATSAPTPSNQIWTKAWNQSRPQFPGASQAPTAQSYSAPGQHYRQQLRFDGKPQPAPVLMGNSDRGNYAYAQPGYRPEAYSQRTTNYTGATSIAPDFNRRDAFISQLNDRLGSYQNRAGVFGSAQPMAPPSYDIQALWDSAGRMVRNGWRNPFAATQSVASPQE